MNKQEIAARVTVIEKQIVTLAILVEQLRQDVLDHLDEEPTDVVGSSHD